jgi:hypothetical protein
MALPSHHLAVIYSEGDVSWIPPVALSSHCPIDAYYFPFDTQVCNIKLGSWTYDQRMVSSDERLAMNIGLVIYGACCRHLTLARNKTKIV